MARLSLPSVTSQIPQDLRNFIDRLRDVIATQGLATDRDVDARVRQLALQTEQSYQRLQDQRGSVAQVITQIDQIILGSKLYQALAAEIKLINGPSDLLGSAASLVAAEAKARAEALAEEAQARIAAAQGALDAALDEIEVVRGEIDLAQTAVDQDIADVNAAIEAADDRITTVKGEIDADIQAANAALTGAQDYAGTMAEAVTEMLSNVDAAIGTVGTRITTVKTGIDQDIQGARDDLNERIDSISSTLADIEATPDFAPGNDYAVDALTRYDGKLYKALQAMTAPSPYPTDPAYWEKVGDYASFSDALLAHGEAIAALNTVSAGSDSAAASTLANLKATVEDPDGGLASKASITALEETKADIYGAEASQFTSLSSEFSYDAALDDVNRLGAEVLARAEASARVDSIVRTEAGIYGAGVEKFEFIEAAFNEATGRITAIETVDVTSGTALVTKVSSMEAALEDPDNPGVLMIVASVEYADEAGATFKSADASQFSGLSAKFTDLETAKGDISALNTITADSSSVLARTASSMKAALSDQYGEVITTGVIERIAQAEVDVKSAALSEFTHINAAIIGDGVNPGLVARIDDIASINIDADPPIVLATTVHGLDATINHPTAGWSSKASLQELDDVRTDVLGAEATRFTGLEATFSYDAAQRDITNLGLDVFAKAEAAARIDSYTRVKSDALGATAEQFTGISAELRAVQNAAAAINSLNTVEVTMDQALADHVSKVSTALTDPDTGEILSTAVLTRVDSAVSEGQKASVSTFTNLYAELYGPDADPDLHTPTTKGRLDKIENLELAEGSVLLESIRALEGTVDGDGTPENPGLVGTINDLDIVDLQDSTARLTSLSTLEAAVGGEGSGLVGKISSLETLDLSNTSALATAARQISAGEMPNPDYDPLDPESPETLPLASANSVTKAFNDALNSEVSSFTKLSAALYGDPDADPPTIGVSGRIDDIQNLTLSPDSALASSISSLEATLDGEGGNPGVTATINSMKELNLTVDTALVRSVQTLQTDVGTAQGRIEAMETLDVTDTSSIVTTVLGLSSAVEGPDGERTVATLGELNTLETDIYGADITAFTQINAKLYGAEGDISAVEGDISTLDKIVITNADSLVNRVNSLSTAVNHPTTGLSTKASSTEMATAISTAQDASVSSFSQINAAFNDPTTGVNAKITYLDEVLTTPTTGVVSRLSGLETSVNHATTGLSSKASVEYVDSAVSDGQDASVISFSQINARFQSTDEDIGSKATITDVSEAIANDTTAIAANVKQLVAETDVGGRTVLEVAGEVTDLKGQYTVKIDNNGYVTGFGLASVPNDLADEDADPSAPEYVSEFYVRANRFAVGAPGVSQVIPFKVLTTAQELADYGVAKAGVYMDSAYITRLRADFTELGITAADIISHAGLGTLATQSSVTTGQVSGLGDLATRNDVRVDNDEVLVWNSSAGGYEAIGTWDFIHKLNKVNSSTIRTYIGDAAITSALIGTAQVGTLKIAGNAVTVPDTRFWGYQLGEGNGHWGYLAGIPYSGVAAGVTHKVQVVFTLRIGYVAGSKTTGYQLKHASSWSSQDQAWAYASADTDGYTSIISDWGTADAFNDFVTITGEAEVRGDKYYVFYIQWYGEDSTVTVVKGGATILGVKR